MASALRHGAFRRLAALYTANVLTEWFGNVALMVVVYAATKSAALAAAMLICRQIVPGLIVPFFGNAIEQRSLRVSIAFSFGIQAVALVGVAALGYGLPLFVLAVLSGVASTLVRAALRTGIARSLEADELRSGNALLNMISGVAAPIGPAIAAGSVAACGASASLAGSGVVMALLAVVGLASRVADLPRPAAQDAMDVEDAASNRIRSSRRAPLAPLLGLVFIVTFLFSMDQPFLLDYSTKSLGAGIGGYGAIFAAWGVGLSIGSVVFTRLLDWPMLRVYALATVLSGSAFLGMSVSPSIAFTCAICVVGGVGNGMDWVAVVTAVQEAAPRGKEGRAMAQLESIGTAGPGIGMLLGGLVAGVAGPRVGLMVPGFSALVLIALGALVLHTRQTRVHSRSVGRSILLPSSPGGSA